MHSSIIKRDKKEIILADGSKLIEFSNCSYFGLDQDPRLLEAAKQTIDAFGVHICVARSRYLPDTHIKLEKNLNEIFKANSITFPSVSVTHLATLPILSQFYEADNPLFVYDHFAHASMQSLKPLLRGKKLEVQTIGHNDLEALKGKLKDNIGRKVLYLADGFYSMGGVAPLQDLQKLQDQYDNLILYIDDAHGTSLVGENGCGYAVDAFGTLNDRTFATFSLAKGFGCNGGGIILNNEALEEQIRFESTPYAFSGPLEYAGAGAALKATEIHLSNEITELQQRLIDNVKLFDRNIFGQEKSFSPIRGINVYDTNIALNIAQKLKEKGFFVPVVFYPVVPKDCSLLRVVITSAHSSVQIESLCVELKMLLSDIPWELKN